MKKRDITSNNMRKYYEKKKKNVTMYEKGHSKRKFIKKYWNFNVIKEL